MFKELSKVALKLYDIGFNIVPVDASKRPLCSWSPSKRIERGELKKLLKKAEGIAVVGGPENPFKSINSVLIIVDVDKPSALEKAPTLKNLIEATVSWLTGPRCPKCEEKHVEVVEYGKRFRCPRCSIEFSSSEAKRGFGALFTVDHEVYEKNLKGTQRLGDVEFLVNNYQLIPPSLHPSGVRYEWVKPFDFNSPNYGIYSLTDVELKAILEELSSLKTVEKLEEKPKEVESRVGKEERLRELKDSELIRIVELLKEGYRPGYRQNMVLFLSGLMAKSKIHPLSVIKIVKMLYEETGDADPLKTRLSAVVYSYKKAGIDIDVYANEIEKLTGVKPYGLEKEISESDVKGKSGLQEILEEVLGEERALAIIAELEEILGTASPWRDSVIELMDYERQIYIVANLRKLLIARAKKSDNRLIYKERIATFAPTKVVVYENPVEDSKKYLITFEGPTLGKPLTIGPATLDEIIARVKREPAVHHTRLIEDALHAIVDAYIKRGKAEMRTEIDKPGFYLIENKLIAAGYNVKDVDKNELREALELLNELAEKWFNHVIERFATVIKWGAIAPFIFARKKLGRQYQVPYLALYGARNTGKTTLAEIATIYLWGLGRKPHECGGGEADSEAKIGKLLSSSTFPVIINEANVVFTRIGVVNILKNSVEDVAARGRHRGDGTYETIPALAPLIFTLNPTPHVDFEGLELTPKTVLLMHFTTGEVLSQSRIEEFRKNVEPRLQKLSAIGNFIASKILKEPELIKEPDWILLGEKLLTEAYREAGLEPPYWLPMVYHVKSFEEIKEEKIESIRTKLVKCINDLYAKNIGRIVATDYQGLKAVAPEDTPIETKLKVLTNNRLIPFIIPYNNRVYITSSIIRELGLEIESLKSLAELLGWNYIAKKTIRIGKKVMCLSVAETTLEDLTAFLRPEPEEKEEKEEENN